MSYTLLIAAGLAGKEIFSLIRPTCVERHRAAKARWMRTQKKYNLETRRDRKSRQKSISQLVVPVVSLIVSWIDCIVQVNVFCRCVLSKGEHTFIRHTCLAPELSSIPFTTARSKDVSLSFIPEREQQISHHSLQINVQKVIKLIFKEIEAIFELLFTQSTTWSMRHSFPKELRHQGHSVDEWMPSKFVSCEKWVSAILSATQIFIPHDVI